MLVSMDLISPLSVLLLLFFTHCRSVLLVWRTTRPSSTMLTRIGSSLSIVIQYHHHSTHDNPPSRVRPSSPTFPHRRPQHAVHQAHHPRNGSSSSRVLSVSHPPPSSPIAIVVCTSRGGRQRLSWFGTLDSGRRRGGLLRGNYSHSRRDREGRHAIQMWRSFANK